MLISLAVWGGQAHALGLGAIALQSGLGRPLQARIPVYGLAADDAGTVCLKTRVLALDGSLLSRPAAELMGSGAGAMVSLRSVESINEPAVNVSVEIGCTSAVKREYQLLLDPLPATLPMAASAPIERADRAGRRAEPRAGASLPCRRLPQ
jgi:Tfp pilus assembly protein FimV